MRYTSKVGPTKGEMAKRLKMVKNQRFEHPK